MMRNAFRAAIFVFFQPRKKMTTGSRHSLVVGAFFVEGARKKVLEPSELNERKTSREVTCPGDIAQLLVRGES